VDGGYIHQIWRVSANILNKQSFTAGKDVLPGCGLGVGIIILHCKMSCTKALELNRFVGTVFEKHEN
jgi:hypothetical protein